MQQQQRQVSFEEDNDHDTRKGERKTRTKEKKEKRDGKEKEKEKGKEKKAKKVEKLNRQESKKQRMKMKNSDEKGFSKKNDLPEEKEVEHGRELSLDTDVGTDVDADTYADTDADADVDVEGNEESVFKLSEDESSFLTREVRHRVLHTAPNSLPLAPAVYKSRGAAAFVDISGFSALGQKLTEQHSDKPRSAASIFASQITFVLKKMTSICLEFGGDVAKFAGDAVLCTFENEDEDEAIQTAKACCKSMLMMIRGYNMSSSSSTNLELHGGIARGSILHIHLSSEDDAIRWYMAAGEAVSNATNAAGLSAPGEIVVVDKTHTGDSFHVFLPNQGNPSHTDNIVSENNVSAEGEDEHGRESGSGNDGDRKRSIQRVSVTKGESEGGKREVEKKEDEAWKGAHQKEEHEQEDDEEEEEVEEEEDGTDEEGKQNDIKGRTSLARLTVAVPKNSPDRLNLQRKKLGETAGTARGLIGIKQKAEDTGGNSNNNSNNNSSSNNIEGNSEHSRLMVEIPEGDSLDNAELSLITADSDLDETFGRSRTQSKDQASMLLMNAIPSHANAYIPKALRQALRRGVVQPEMRSQVGIVFLGMEDLALSSEELSSSKVQDWKLSQMNTAFVELTGITNAFEGEVRDLLFDDKGCVYIAVFGAHKNIDMPALKALKAAIAMTNEITNATAGVSIGDCFVGLCGGGSATKRHDLVVMGNEVNVAARYMGVARPGEVYASQAVRDATHEVIQFTEVDVATHRPNIPLAGPSDKPHLAKNKTAFRPDRDLARRPSFLAQYRYGQNKKDFFMGRQEELELIEEALNDAFHSRKHGKESAFDMEAVNEEESSSTPRNQNGNKNGSKNGGGFKRSSKDKRKDKGKGQEQRNNNNNNSSSSNNSKADSRSSKNRNNGSWGKSRIAALLPGRLKSKKTKSKPRAKTKDMDDLRVNRHSALVRRKDPNSSTLLHSKKTATRLLWPRKPNKPKVGVIVIEGEAGMGKTSLAAKVKKLAKLRVVTASGTANAVAFEATLSVWEQIISSFLKIRLDQGRQSAESAIVEYENEHGIELNRKALAKLLPSLFPQSTSENRKSKLSGLIGNGREQKEIVDTLIRIFKTGPRIGNKRKKNGTLLIIEDLHNLDVDSLCVLKEMFIRLSELKRFVIMVTTRALHLVDGSFPTGGGDGSRRDGQSSSRPSSTGVGGVGGGGGSARTSDLINSFRQSLIDSVVQSKMLPPMEMQNQMASVVYTLAVQLAHDERGLYLELSGMGEQTCFIFVTKLLGKSNPEMIERSILNAVYKRSQGYPMFASSLVAWMKENNLAMEDESGKVTWQGEKAIEKTTFPNSVADSVVSRLDSLPVEAKNVLKFASAVGDEFSASYLESVSKVDPPADVTPMNADEILSAIKLAFDHGLMIHVKSKSPDEKDHTWRWKHDSVRESIKSLLTDARLAEIEAAVARIGLKRA